MATIEKRTNVKGEAVYRIKVRLKGSPAQSESFKRLTDAKKWAQQTEAAIREGRYFKTAEAKRHTLADLIDRYITGILPAKKDAAQQHRQLLWWRRQLGHALLADLTSAALSEQRDVLKSLGKSPATVNRYLAALSHAFTIAVQEYAWMDASPMTKIRREKEPRGRVRYLSNDERNRLLTACAASPNPDLHLAVVLSLATGARKMEILTLRWNEVNLERGKLILLETKNGDRRALPIGDRARELLTARAATRRLDTELLFPSPDNLNRPAQLRHAWQAALKAAQIDNFRWHDLRHSAASYLAMTGASLQEIAAILGHKTLAMVKRYAHLSDQHIAGVVNRMNADIFG